MDIREAVKDKANYADIVTYFQNLNILDLDQMALLIDTIDEMSEEIFEHYRALQLIFRKEAADIIEQRKQEGSFEEILENVKQRDYIDQHREVSPLRKADDALLLDNSNLSIEQQKEWLSEQFGKIVNK